MGALTSNRKRGEGCYTLNYKSPPFSPPVFDWRVDTHVSKKPKISPSMHQSPDRPVSAESTVRRLYQYPDVITQFRREVHAPCRATRFGFGFGGNSRRSGVAVDHRVVKPDVMGNALASNYLKAKSLAIGALRYLKKDKEVIDVDEETVKDDVSEDSMIEEVETTEDRREGRSVVSGEDIREKISVVSNLPELDVKIPSSSSGVSDMTNANLKLDSAGKMLDLSSLNRELDVLDVPLHKKLLHSAERYNDNLSRLKFEIELNEKRWSSLQSLRAPKKLEEDVVAEPFKPLTKEDEEDTVRAFTSSNRRKVLVSHENSGIEITGEVLMCLRPGAWLNDEVINLYLELLKEREKREPKKFLKCHFFNTFFYKKLIGGRSGYDFKSVRRWTTQRRLGYSLFDCDKIFVPIHKEIHWCLAVINKKEEKFQYLDSLGGIDNQVLEVLARYFIDEVKEKSGKDIDVSFWKQEFVEDLPEQENGFDCGMFMIKYADFYSRDIGLCFNQQHMPYFRLRTAKEILKLKAE